MHWYVVDNISGDKELPLADDTRHIAVRSAYALHGDPPRLATLAATNEEVVDLVRAAEASASNSGVCAAFSVHMRIQPQDSEVKDAQYENKGIVLLRYKRVKSAPLSFDN